MPIGLFVRHYRPNKLLKRLQYFFSPVNAYGFLSDHLGGDLFDQNTGRSSCYCHLAGMQGHMSTLDPFSSESPQGGKILGQPD
jgi:hypothetical protein